MRYSPINRAIARRFVSSTAWMWCSMPGVSLDTVETYCPLLVSCPPDITKLIGRAETARAEARQPPRLCPVIRIGVPSGAAVRNVSRLSVPSCMRKTFLRPMAVQRSASTRHDAINAVHQPSDAHHSGWLLGPQSPRLPPVDKARRSRTANPPWQRPLCSFRPSPTPVLRDQAMAAGSSIQPHPARSHS